MMCWQSLQPELFFRKLISEEIDGWLVTDRRAQTGTWSLLSRARNLKSSTTCQSYVLDGLSKSRTFTVAKLPDGHTSISCFKHASPENCVFWRKHKRHRIDSFNKIEKLPINKNNIRIGGNVFEPSVITTNIIIVWACLPPIKILNFAICHCCARYRLRDLCCWHTLLQ